MKQTRKIARVVQSNRSSMVTVKHEPLKPCPFCGGVAEFGIGTMIMGGVVRTRIVYCTSCFASSPQEWSNTYGDVAEQSLVEFATEKWNRRYTPKPLQGGWSVGTIQSKIQD